MKMLLCILVLIIFTIFGYCFACKYKERKKFYNDFSIFNSNLISEISFGQETIINIINKIETSSIFNDKLKDFFIKKDKNIENVSFLDNDENTYLLLYFQKIGTADKESQLEYLKQVEIFLNKKVKNCLDDYEKYYLTSIKMGFLLGLIAFIFLL